MKLKKAIAAILATLLITVLVCGCSYNPAVVMTINNRDISNGEYLYAQYVALSNLMSENEITDSAVFLKSEIDGVSGAEAVHNETLRLLRESVFIRDEAERLEIKLDSWTAYMASYYANSYWTDYGVSTIMERNGISYYTYELMVQSQYITTEMFNYYYGEGGPKEVAVSDLKDYYNSHFANALLIAFPTKALDSSDLSAEQLEVFRNVAQKITDGCNNGASFKDVVMLNYSEVLKARMENDTEFSEADYTAALVDTVFSLDDTGTYSEALINKLIASEGAGWFEEDGKIYVFQRKANFTTEDEFKAVQGTALESMKYDEFAKFVTDSAADYEVVVNERAVKHYSVNKVKV